MNASLNYCRKRYVIDNVYTEHIYDCSSNFNIQIVCESSVLEYFENIMQSEERKLNELLRDLTKLHHKATNIKNENILQIEDGSMESNQSSKHINKASARTIHYFQS